MTPEAFLKNFGVLVDAPDGVPKLRRIILELAVRGKLTLRLAEDEPAEVLLSRVYKERQELMTGRRVGGRGQTSESAEFIEEGMPYALPPNWKWCTLADVAGHIVDGTHHTPKYVTAGVDFISAKDIKDGQIRFDGCRKISQAEFDELSKRCWPKKGDILVTKSGSIGEVAVVRTNRLFTLFESVALVPIVPSVDREYASRVVYLGASGKFGEENRKGVAVKHLHLKDLRRLPFPLPPSEEQKRIVAKVDQLMALCDELEARQAKKRETGTRLTQSALDALTSAQGSEEFAKAWQRVSGNFEVLLDTPGSIGKVRKTILELAVRGKLVRQDPKDRPSKDLLAKVAMDRSRSTNTSSRAPVKASLPVSELPALPASWTWVEFGSLLIFGPKNGYSPKAVEYPTKVKSLTLSATTGGEFDGSCFKFIDEDIAPDSDLWLREGDILIQRGNTIDYVGIAAVYHGAPREFIHPDLMMKVRLSPHLDIDFFHIALNSLSSRRFIQGKATGTAGSMPKINQTVVMSIPVPVPPLEEQKRISARVKQFMSLCDMLESKLRDAEQGAQRLAEAMAAEMVA